MNSDSDNNNDNNRLKYRMSTPSLSATVSLGADVVRLMIRQALPSGQDGLLHGLNELWSSRSGSSTKYGATKYRSHQRGWYEEAVEELK